MTIHVSFKYYSPFELLCLTIALTELLGKIDDSEFECYESYFSIKLHDLTQMECSELFTFFCVNNQRLSFIASE